MTINFSPKKNTLAPDTLSRVCNIILLIPNIEKIHHHLGHLGVVLLPHFFAKYICTLSWEMRNVSVQDEE